MKKPSRKDPEGKDQGWQEVSQWYDRCVGREGHFYHRELLLPRLKERGLLSGQSVLDLGCGQGILERELLPGTHYLGVDASASLLRSAQRQRLSPSHAFLQADLNAAQEFSQRFSHVFFLLSLQNISCPAAAIATAAAHLHPDGKLVIVLNHPCFRIPRQSSWSFDTTQSKMSRKLDSYLSSQAIPIQTHPSQPDGQSSVSYHYSLTQLFGWLQETGLKVEQFDEWVCPKRSEGGRAKAENRARKEFPLFLLLVASF